MRREHGYAESGEDRPEQQRHIDIGRDGRHSHAEKNCHEHRQQQGDELEQRRAALSEFKRLQPAEDVERDEGRQTGELKAEIDDRYGEEHQIEGRDQDAGIRQGIDNLHRPRPHLGIDKQKPDQQNHRIPAGAAGIAGGVANQLVDPGIADNLTAGLGDQPFSAGQHAEHAASDSFLLRQEKDEDQQDGSENHHQIEQILAVEPHIVGQASDRLYVLLARLEDHRQEKAEEIGKRRNGGGDDDVGIGNAGQRGEDEGGDAHHRRHHRPAG